MKRREFVTLIGGAAAWLIAARAQRFGAMRHIAVVGALAPDDIEVGARSAAFEQALAALGWTKGGTIAIDYHWVANDTALAQKTAVEVVALAPDVLLGCAPCKGGAFQWVQAPPGKRSSRKQSEQSWR
jgi:putative ABC transport system substrate-binding protein